MTPNLTAYLLTLLIGLACAAALFIPGLSRRKLPLGIAAWGLPLMVLLALAGSRAVYLLARFEASFSRWGLGALWRVVPDELSFVGGCLGAVLGLCLAARLNQRPAALVLDAFAPAGALLVAFARAGEYFLGGKGLGSDIPDGHWACFVPLAVQNNWQIWLLAVYTLEALFALAVTVYALLLRGKLAPGLRFEHTAVLLCAGQTFFEMLVSGALSYSFVRIDQVLCALYLLFVIQEHCVHSDRSGFRRWRPLVIFALLIGVHIALQFMLDKPYLFTAALSEDAAWWVGQHLKAICYSAMAVLAVGMVACQRVSAKHDVML